METLKTDFTRALVLAQSEVRSQTKNWWCSKILWMTDLVRISKLQALLELEVSHRQRKETDLSSSSSVLCLSKLEIVRSKPQVSQVYIRKKPLGQLETRLMQARLSTIQGLKQLKPSHQSKTKSWPSPLRVHSLVKSRLKWWLLEMISWLNTSQDFQTHSTRFKRTSSSQTWETEWKSLFLIMCGTCQTQNPTDRRQTLVRTPCSDDCRIDWARWLIAGDVSLNTCTKRRIAWNSSKSSTQRPSGAKTRLSTVFRASSLKNF